MVKRFGEFWFMIFIGNIIMKFVKLWLWLGKGNKTVEARF